MSLGSGIRNKPIPDPGSRIQGSKSTQSRIPDPDPQHCIKPKVKLIGGEVFVISCTRNYKSTCRAAWIWDGSECRVGVFADRCPLRHSPAQTGPQQPTAEGIKLGQ